MSEKHPFIDIDGSGLCAVNACQLRAHDPIHSVPAAAPEEKGWGPIDKSNPDDWTRA